ncbi:hypothetical protein WJX73_005038 [Symbiochloris irregularis]|uniref:Glutathione S-transferase n=1 Tax=Symbiochloris irregularis TaxID=706552 RepID=A0AAW1P592_9CHLO
MQIACPEASGAALRTVQTHESTAALVAHPGWFCPFSQRAWIVLEEKKVSYQYKETNPHTKDKNFLAINPKGLIPVISHKGVNVSESQVVMEYLEDITGPDVRMYPADALQRAVARMWIDHIAKKIVPCFFRVLQAQEVEKQRAAETDLLAGITDFVNAMDPGGPFFFGDWFSMVDAFIAPWMMRSEYVMKHFKGFDMPQRGSGPVWSRWWTFVEAVQTRKSVVDTTSELEHYLPNLQKYANDTAQTQAAKATREGRDYS